MLPAPPKPQCSSIFDLFWISFGHVFDLKSIYVRTRIESNDPMFKLHKEKKVTTLCLNTVAVARPATSATQQNDSRTKQQGSRFPHPRSFVLGRRDSRRDYNLVKNTKIGL